MSEVMERPLEDVVRQLGEMPVGNRIEAMIRVRRKKAEIAERHKRELAPVNRMAEALELSLLSELNNLGLDNMKSVHGMVYKSTRTSAKVEDWPKVLDYIREHGSWEMLERRVSKDAVTEAIEATGTPVPGVAIRTETTLNVRAA